MNYKGIFLIFAFQLLTYGVAFSQHSRYVIPEDDKVIAKLEEFRDLKFGLFMHWGTYSQWGIVESWSICPEDEAWCLPDTVKNYFAYKKNYENLQKTFNPVKFDPEKWANAAKNAGFKYVVFTTKHHDGFSMFDSKYTHYKITDKDCPFHTQPNANVTKEIFTSFRDKGMWIGAYFSKPDWNHPDYWWPQFPPFDRNVNYDPEKYPERWNRFVDFTHNQLMELSSDYGKIDIYWFDGGWAQKNNTTRTVSEIPGFKVRKLYNQDLKIDELVSKIREKQPGAIIVDRGSADGKHENYITPEDRVPEQMIPHPWESCIITGKGWSYRFNDVFKPTRELIHLLVDIVSKGGNLLLNVGPSPDGTWDDEIYKRFDEIGKWLEINGEAIYRTRPIAPYFDGKIRYTQSKNGTIYAMYLVSENESSFPAELKLNGITIHPEAKMTLVGNKSRKLKYVKTQSGLNVTLPADIRDNSKYALVIKIDYPQTIK